MYGKFGWFLFHSALFGLVINMTTPDICFGLPVGKIAVLEGTNLKNTEVSLVLKRWLPDYLQQNLSLTTHPRR